MGVGVLALAAGVSVSVWVLQPDNGSGPVLGANQGAPALEGNSPSGLETGVGWEGVPDRPTRDNSAVGSSSEAEATQVQDTGVAAPGLTAVEGATLGDSAELEVRRGEAPPSGGPGDVAGMGDSAEIVVRDASGNIKKRETVR